MKETIFILQKNIPKVIKYEKNVIIFYKTIE